MLVLLPGTFPSRKMHSLLTAVLSSVMNNMPSALISPLPIDVSSAQCAVCEAMIEANIIASDLGPMIMPIASLATLLWLPVPATVIEYLKTPPSRTHAVTIAGKHGRACSRRSLRKMWLRSNCWL